MTTPFAATDKSLETVVGRYVPSEAVADVCQQARTFAYGECGILAGRLHSITGWGNVFLYDGAGGRPLPLHYCVRSPRGLVDSFGLCPHRLEYMVSSRQGVSSPVWNNSTGDAGFTDQDPGDVARADVFLDTPWMQAVLSASGR
ncbi:MAG: hypothetical protein VR70_11105 [Rhodospirillaceae bacterium BRH_c57]|nr:MAG: hypothetical protein VR70_11105 [Rhodospirillaceae bacterium BRH_c57]